MPLLFTFFTYYTLQMGKSNQGYPSKFTFTKSIMTKCLIQGWNCSGQHGIIPTTSCYNPLPLHHLPNKQKIAGWNNGFPIVTAGTEARSSFWWTALHFGWYTQTQMKAPNSSQPLNLLLISNGDQQSAFEPFITGDTVRLFQNICNIYCVLSI